MSDKITDKLVGSGVKPELSPNPNGSGYTKQVEVDSLVSIANPEGNVLYICQGRKYKYLAQAIIDPATNKVLVPTGFVRVENGPQVHNVDGERGTPVHENVAPQVPPRVFNEPVALNGGVTIKGKQLEDYIDSEGGVTEEELANALTLYAKKVDSAQKYVVVDIDTIPSATIALLKAGDVVLVETVGVGDAPNIYDTWIVTKKQDQVSCEISHATGKSVESIYYTYSVGNWVRNSDNDCVYGVADLKINGNSVVDENGEVDLITGTAYDPNTNPIATVADAGGKLYLHNISMNSNNQHIVVYSNNLTPFTNATLAKILYDGGFTTKTRALRFAAGNDLELSGSTKLIMQHGIFSANGTTLKRSYYNLDIVAGTGFSDLVLNETTQSTITDVVVEM